MKKILLTLLLTTMVSVVQAQQFTFFNEDTAANVNDGDVITVNTDQFTTNLILTNNSTVPIKATLEVVDIVNTDGSEMSFCFGINGGGNCYFAMTEGATYDSNANNTQYLQPGDATGSSDIDFTHNDSNPNFTNYPKDYVLKFKVLNANDDTVLGEINFTYRYDPNANTINTFGKNEIFISTAHRHTLIVSSKYVAHVSLFNLTGKKVKEVTLKPSQNHIYTGGMAPGIYIVHVQANGKELYKKIILK